VHSICEHLWQAVPERERQQMSSHTRDAPRRAMPERAQQIGAMLSLGMNVPQWRRMTTELPEIVPRGATGWQRYY
jgi:hypothetical protein